MPLRRDSSRGLTLIELLTTIAILGLVVTLTVPAFQNYRRRAAVRAASVELRSIFRLVRSRAVAHSRYAAVKFRQNGDRWVWSVYEDGDWDGVHNDDIRRGVDRCVGPPRVLLEGIADVAIALPSFPLPDPDTGRVLRPGTSPVRFGRSTLCSFSPRGAGSSGTIFLTDGHQMCAAVRVYGPTARVRTERYDIATGRWEAR